MDSLRTEAERLQLEGNTVVYAAVDRKPAGIIAIADPIKETTPQAIAELHRLGRRVVMLTGDNKRTATAVGQKLAMDEIHAEVAPQAKQQVVTELRRAGMQWQWLGTG